MNRLSKELRLFPGEAMDVGSSANMLKERQTYWTEVLKIFEDKELRQRNNSIRQQRALQTDSFPSSSQKGE